MAVCMDDTAMQFMLMMLIIDHLAAVHQCLDACNEILGVLSQPGHIIFEFSKMQLGIDIVCHSLLDSVKEGRSFCLGHFLFLFAAYRHPLCMHLQGFGSQGSKIYQRWSSLSGGMQLRRSQFSRLQQNMEKESDRHLGNPSHRQAG